MSIRSLLITPSLKPDIIKKALACEADALLLELEDGIHPSRKAEARAALVELFHDRRTADKRAIVRINDIYSRDGFADLRALVMAGASELMLPKVRRLAEIELADDLLRRAEADAALPIYSVGLWVMLETTEGVLNANEILAHRRLRGVLMGSGDLSAELMVSRIGLGANRTLWDFPMELLYAKQHCVLAARAHGLIAIDTGVTNFRDLEATEHAGRIGAQMGFDGCLALSPRQLEVIHACFTPLEADYEWARAALDAIRAAESCGETVTVLNGEMIEGPLIRNANTIVRRYERANPSASREQAPTT